MVKKVLITGITGQDGYYLTKLLLSKGYEVHGLHRRKGIFSLGHLSEPGVGDKIYWHMGDLTDSNSINKILRSEQFDEIYHLGAQSFVKESFNNPEYTMQVNTIGTLNLLTALRMFQPNARFYNASTSEIFGNSPMPENGYKINSEKLPRSPYGVSKLAAYELCKIYRFSYDLFICNGILFNHESPHRGDEFVTQKIVKGIINAFKTWDTLDFEPLVLGNLKAHRDWGFAGDYVEAMYLMLQQPTPYDYLVATGESHSVLDFCNFVIENMNNRNIFEEPLKLEDLVVTNDDFKRPLEVDYLLGNSSVTQQILGWSPKTSLKELINMMIEAQL